jgi:hypothetical protein
MQTWLIVGAAVVAALCGVADGARAGQPPTLEQIITSWGHREQQLHSARLTWVEHRNIPKGSTTTGEKGNTKSIPATDVSFDVAHRMVFDHEKIRHSWEGKIWSARGQLTDQNYVAAFNGKTAKDLWPPGAQNFPFGGIHKGSTIPNVNDMVIRPVLLAFRPLSKEAGIINPKKLSMTVQTAIVDGRSCICVRSGPEFFLVDQTDHLVQRYWTERDGKVGTKLDLCYTNDPTSGRLLSTWRSLYLRPDGRILESSDVTIRSCLINPADTDSSEFEIEFPVGTRVYDYTTPFAGKPHSSYIVRNDGTKRLITPEENVGLTYDQLKQLDVRVPFYLSKPFIIINLTVLVLATVFVVLRWRTARRGPSSSGK